MARKPGEREVAQSILRYLEQRPEAGDTLEGIAKWWMLRQRLAESVVVVRRALQDLIARGLIEERPLPGGNAFYVLSGASHDWRR